MSSPADHPYRRSLYRILENRAWLDAHIEALMAQYKSKWIAIYREEVVASADSPDELRGICQDKVDMDETIIFQVPGAVRTPI